MNHIIYAKQSESMFTVDCKFETGLAHAWELV